RAMAVGLRTQPQAAGRRGPGGEGGAADRRARPFGGGARHAALRDPLQRQARRPRPLPPKALIPWACALRAKVFRALTLERRSALANVPRPGLRPGLLLDFAKAHHLSRDARS